MSLWLLSVPILADIQPRSASLNYSQKSLSNAGNPAAAALIVTRKDPHVMMGGSIELGAGLEYGNLDELFAKIDQLSAQFNPPKDDDQTKPKPPTPENPISDYQWVDLFAKYPELEDRLAVVKKKVASTAGLIALIAAEGYGKAEATSDLNFILNDDLYGGTLLLGMAYKGNAKAIGIFDEIKLDSEQAKEQLKTIPTFTEDDPVQALDLSGGITLFYNPENKKVNITMDNDSLLLIKATKVGQVSLSYSQLAFHGDTGDLYWGIKPTLYRVGLTNVGTRMGEITDSEGLFEDINNAEFRYQNGFDIDLGVVWAANYYQFGVSVTNLIENTYAFPTIERSRFSSVNVLNQLNYHEKFTMQRQVKLSAGIYTNQRHWSLNAELDANPVVDPMRDRYQWLTVTGGYASDSWWLPSVRIGFSRNLAGSHLAYLNAGITMMKFINIDVATTLDRVTLNGDDMRRGANIRIGFQFDY